MKTLLAAAAAVALAGVAAPSFAQGMGELNPYVTVGGAYAESDGSDIGAIAGRVGIKGRYVGVEGEGSFGVSGDDSLGVDVDLKHQFAAYLVGFAPVSPNADIFARIGYGTQKFEASAGGVSASARDESVNYGVGAQYFFDGSNGVRADYTRHDFDDGGDANVWGLSYIHKF